MKRACAAIVSIAAVACAGCTSTQDVLEPSAVAATSQGDMAPPQQVATAAPLVNEPDSATPVVRDAARAGAARILLAPVVGAPPEEAAPLTERLAQQAKDRGIMLAGTGDPATTHVLKGYFSALSENGTTTVIYVWDVYDRAGARLHRITGQQSSPSGRQEGWAAVPAATMRAIADQTVNAFAAWAAGRTG